MSRPVIKIENLSKLYRIGEVGTGTISHDLNRWWSTQIRGKQDPYAKIGQVNDRTVKTEKDEYVWSLKDVNLEVQQGEILGIIGKNGAGKSTLLKLLSRITLPTSGSIKVKGRLASLLEVGTGFHHEMTGRENIYMNGTIMGMRKWEIDKKLDEIVDFAGIAKYLDTPAKRYSSGMTVRLGFAVAAFLEPEILVVDEVLAVGDAEFQKKAIGKMQDVSKGEGRTVLFVSHNMSSITNLCSRSLILENGSPYYNGTVNQGVNIYLERSRHTSNYDLINRTDRKGNGTLKFEKCKLINDQGKESDAQCGSNAVFEIQYEATKRIDSVSLIMEISDQSETTLLLCNSIHIDRTLNIQKGKGKVCLNIKNLPLTSGRYSYDLIASDRISVLDEVCNAGIFYVEPGDFYGTGKLPVSKSAFLVQYSWDAEQ